MGRGWAAQVGEDLADHGRVFDGRDDRQGPATLGTVARSRANTRLRSWVKLILARDAGVWGSCLAGGGGRRGRLAGHDLRSEGRVVG